jgi:hypothetical protein
MAFYIRGTWRTSVACAALNLTLHLGIALHFVLLHILCTLYNMLGTEVVIVTHNTMESYSV